MNSINQIRSFNYNKNQKSNSNPHFDGRGKIVREFHKFDEIICSNCKFKKQFATLGYLEELNSSIQKLKEDLIAKNIIDKEGNVIELIPPKKVTIKEDLNEWIPDEIEADEIIMEGGEVKTLIGKKIIVKNDSKVTEFLKADTLETRNTATVQNASVSYLTKMFNFSTILGLKTTNLWVKDKAKAYNAIIRGVANITEKSRLEASTIRELVMRDNSEAIDINVTDKASLYNFSKAKKAEFYNLSLNNNAEVTETKVKNLTELHDYTKNSGFQTKKLNDYRLFTVRISKYLYNMLSPNKATT